MLAVDCLARVVGGVVLAVALGGMLGIPAVADDAPAPEPLGQPDTFGGYTTGHIVVRFSSDEPDPIAQASPTIEALNATWQVQSILRVYPFEFTNPNLAARFGLDRTYIFNVPAGTDTPAMSAAYAMDADVEFAEVDGIGGVAQFIPDDSDFDLLYGLHNVGQTGGVIGADIDAPEAWEVHSGDYGTVTVAIVDSGVDPHTEFGDRLISGINANDPTTPDLTTDDCPHGTHVAGTVGARGNNGAGVAGMSWGALIMPVRVVDGCWGFESHCATGIIWAADHGADICNLSLQYYTGTRYLRDSVDYARALGVLLIAAAGNSHGPTVAYPARFANCVGVSATDDRDELAWFSNYGDQLDVCAPGDAIWSTWVDNAYGYRSGTSMATPLVSGLAALILSLSPELTNGEVRALLTSTADDLGSPGWDASFGFGRINAYAALTAADTRIDIIASMPPAGAIDARQPFAFGGGDRQGWQFIELIFDGEAFGLTPAAFTVVQEGGVGPAPRVIAIAPLAPERALLILSGPIEVGAWTSLVHIDSGTSVRLGYLPGDANGDGTSGPPDILALIDALNEVGEAVPIWFTDINRSGSATPLDILREIDLLNGAGAYEAYNGLSLP